MTNYEKIKSMNIENLADVLCGLSPNCSVCRVSHLCDEEKSGFIEWLEWEVKENN